MIKRIAYTLYPVVDMARARKFYEGELGLMATADYADGQWVEFDVGGCFVLTTMTPVKPSTEAGGHAAFEVDDVVAMTEKLRNSGVPVLKEVMETPGYLMSVVVDPEGNAVTLRQET